MRLTQIITATKINVAHGVWSDNKLRPRDFCLSKKPGKAYPLTRMWRWRVTTFEAHGRKFRLMPAYHKLVPEFAAILAEEVGTDCRILARLEYHGSHMGWHAHVLCGDVDRATSGIVKPTGVRRFPGGGLRHRHDKYLPDQASMDDEIAAAIAMDFFRLPQAESLFATVVLPWT